MLPPLNVLLVLSVDAGAMTGVRLEEGMGRNLWCSLELSSKVKTLALLLAQVCQQPPQGAKAFEAFTTIASMFVAAAVALCCTFACVCQ